MRAEHKEFISNYLKQLEKNNSHEKIAYNAGVSGATINHMINGKWGNMKDELWYKVKVKLAIDWDWAIVPTQNFKIFYSLLEKVQKKGISICICHSEGSGKTTAYEQYQRNNPKVILIRCKNYWTKKSFAKHQLLACGIRPSGTTEDMIEEFIDYLLRNKGSVVIYDQFDKLKESQKDIYMDCYNEVDGVCGFVLSGVEALRIQEKKGCEKNKMGYRERHSRYGSKFIKGNKLNLMDVRKICEANGVSDADKIKEIFDECGGDKRRVKRSIEAFFEELQELHKSEKEPVYA